MARLPNHHKTTPKARNGPHTTVNTMSKSIEFWSSHTWVSVACPTILPGFQGVGNGVTRMGVGLGVGPIANGKPTPELSHGNLSHHTMATWPPGVGDEHF